MNYLFNTEALGGILTCVSPNKKMLKTETTGEGKDRVVVKLNEIRSSDLVAGDGETLQIVDDKIVVVPRPTKVLTPAEQIKDLWASLTDDEKAAVYTYAPNAILAWERDEMGVMIKLILANTEPAIATLKESVKAILGI